jgi:precorrin-6B methylase 1
MANQFPVTGMESAVFLFCTRVSVTGNKVYRITMHSEYEQRIRNTQYSSVRCLATLRREINERYIAEILKNMHFQLALKLQKHFKNYRTKA